MDLIVVRPEGLYCPPGDFHVDPWRPVAHAILTHAHGDHARPGSRRYVASQASVPVLRARLGDVALQALAYGERITRHGVSISLHPAGHVLGSAQVRIEHRGETWVVSGDYKLDADPTCAAFEPVRANVFITESTFGLPVYRWRDPARIVAEIAQWWRTNAEAGRTSILYAYAFGKAQRIVAALRQAQALDIGALACHGAIATINDVYRASGVDLPPVVHATRLDAALLPRALVLAPPSAAASPWLRRFGDFSDAFASGWMQVRGARRRRALDRGFALSDHADWPGLNAAIEASGAARVIVTHGQVATMVRWLAERGFDAQAFETQFADEGEPEAAQVAPAAREEDPQANGA